MIEIFCQIFIVSNVISAFLDNLKPKFFFTGQLWWPTSSAPLFKIPGFAPAKIIFSFVSTAVFSFLHKTFSKTMAIHWTVYFTSTTTGFSWQTCYFPLCRLLLCFCYHTCHNIYAAVTRFDNILLHIL